MDRQGSTLHTWMLSIFAIHLCILSTIGKDLDHRDIPIIVLSQANLHHADRAEIFKKHLYDQGLEPDNNPEDADIYLLHERWTNPGAWTILPIIPDLVRQFPGKSAIFFCEEETRIDIKKLFIGLSHYDFTKELFLGRGLRDREATIIHHFAFHESPSSFVYPDFAGGVVLSMPLLESLAKRMLATPLKTDFAIDAKHELAMYIYNNGEGLRMQEANFLCTTNLGEHCATNKTLVFPYCGEDISADHILFAVKTCEKFHEERVPVVKRTWGIDAKNIEFYSEKEDPNIPTIDLGVPNTERGHCGKTMAILKRFRSEKKFQHMKWLVITDDDTLLSVERLTSLLLCYDPEEPVAIGERYGYGVSDDGGYNYLTGGGGMVFSMPAVKMLIDLGLCQCGTDDAPDDMMLGMCLKRLGIIIVHSAHFHQARPMDYARDYLFHQEPVSFHKHWMVDPYKIYKLYLAKAQQHDEF